jgi:hypothetical protein
MLKNTAVTFLLGLMFASFAFAEPTDQPAPVDPSPVDQPNPDQQLLADAEKYRWLYEALFSAQDRDNSPKESFKSFYVHLADSDKYFPAPEMIQAKNLRQLTQFKGTMGYVSGIVRKGYVYDVIPGASLTFHIKVYFKNPKGDDLKNFREKLAGAQDIWNASRVQADFDYSFQFDVTEDKAQAHYSVNILDTTRGPYDTNWGRDWNSTTIAHELGHMMGIADEYQTLSGKMDCLQTSLMCSSWHGKLMPHHYYFILRRLVAR